MRLPDPVPFPSDRVRKKLVRRYPTPRGGTRELRFDADAVPAKHVQSIANAARIEGLRAVQPLATNGGLDAYTGNLTLRQAKHLLRRTGFGGSPDEVSLLVDAGAATAVDAIVDFAVSEPHPAAPAWAATPPPGPNATEEEWMAYNEWTFTRLDEFRRDWLKLMSTHGLREKMTLFWHDHFATSQDKYYHVQIAQRYVELLRTNSLGNFRQFVYDIGLDAAMLIFLDGFENRKDAPNENYARELCELFTMGITDRYGNPNYTENDIKEIARGLTGYVINGNLEVQFFNVIHDGSPKTIFGRSGNWGYDDVIDIVFDERSEETAWYISKKLYQEFVYEVANEEVVDHMKDLLIASNWELEPVIRALLKSEHFFSEAVIGARIASPTEMMIRLLKEVGGYADDHFTVVGYAGWSLEQWLTFVPSVNGWPRHRDWISTTTMPERWAVCSWLLWVNDIAPRLDIYSSLEKLVDFQDPNVAFRVGPAVVEHLFAVPIEELDVESISASFAGDLTTHPIPQDVANGPAYVRDLTKMFLNGVPWYEWNPYNPDLDWVYRLFLQQIVQIPEFQLT